MFPPSIFNRFVLFAVLFSLLTVSSSKLLEVSAASTNSMEGSGEGSGHDDGKQSSSLIGEDDGDITAASGESPQIFTEPLSLKEA
ncbi:hypothetical protein AB6A40_005986 [Gnathostoma spinigerum]|uniref:Uncharacterized protein n=1 Tax=Gnathostoma spinigerum TaxID=75299 RepID=A0ABD6ERG8_9BILA